MIKIAPSILAVDFSVLGSEIKRVEKAGADMIHIDVMDGHFVPNLTIGPPVIKSIRKCSKLPFDVHLMINNAEKYIDTYASAGADIITIHMETDQDIVETVRKIKSLGIKAGIALNPNTSLDTLKHVMTEVDMILLMSVYPGFGGQKYISSTTAKIAELRNIITSKGLCVDIEVDGGITDENVTEVVRAGANVIVAGSYIFGAPDVAMAIKTLKDSSQSSE